MVASPLHRRGFQYRPLTARSENLSYQLPSTFSAQDLSEEKLFAHPEIALRRSLSRGSDNAQERGVVAEFPLSGANLLRIILVANLGGLWTNRGDNHVEVAR